MADLLHPLDRLAGLLPELTRLAALAVGEGDHARLAPGAGRDGDGAARPPDEVGRVRPDHEQAPAHASTPATRLRVHHRHRVHLLLVEAGCEEPVGHQPEAVLDRRVRHLAEIGREHRVLGPGGADRLVDGLPGDLAGVRRREAALEQGAARGQRGLVVDRQALRREVGMRDDELAHALLERGVHDGEDLVP